MPVAVVAELVRGSAHRLRISRRAAINVELIEDALHAALSLVALDDRVEARLEGPDFLGEHLLSLLRDGVDVLRHPLDVGSCLRRRAEDAAQLRLELLRRAGE